MGHPRTFQLWVLCFGLAILGLLTLSSTPTQAVDTAVDQPLSIEIVATPATAIDGQPIELTYTITNNSDEVISNVQLTEQMGANCAATFDTLAVGGVATYRCQRTAMSPLFVSQATVAVSDDETVSATTGVKVAVAPVGVKLSVSASADSAARDQAVTLTYLIENTGESRLENVLVTDSEQPTCNSSLAAIAGGESAEVTCTVSGTPPMLASVATVSAVPTNGGYRGNPISSAPAHTLIPVSSTPTAVGQTTVTTTQRQVDLALLWGVIAIVTVHVLWRNRRHAGKRVMLFAAVVLVGGVASMAQAEDTLDEACFGNCNSRNISRAAGISWTSIGAVGANLDINWGITSDPTDGGFFEVSYADAATGSYTVAGTTYNNTRGHFVITGLAPETSYHVRIREYLPQSDSWSSYHNVGSFLTPALCQVPADYSTIQAAIDDAACAGAEIATGYYPENLAIDRPFGLRGATYQTVLDGGNAGSVITVAGGHAYVFEGLILQSGKAERGAGLRMLRNQAGFGANVTMVDSVLQANTAEAVNGSSWGGAIFNENGRLTTRDVHVEGNSADFGGGIVQYAEGELDLTRTSLLFNTAVSGAGIFNLHGDTYIRASWLDSNTANDNGGGIRQSAGSLNINTSSVNANFATSGGGIYADGAACEIAYSSITGNSAQNGGGFYNREGELTFRDGNISGNGGNLGAGGYSTGDSAFTTIRNAAMYGNGGGYGGALFAEKGRLHTFYMSIANNTAWDGAGIYVNSDSLTFVNMNGTSLIDNEAGNEGGGARMARTALTAEGIYAQGNGAVRGGIFYFADGATSARITSSHLLNAFGGGEACQQGCGIFNQDGLLELGGVHIQGDGFYTPAHGLGIYTRGGELTLLGGEISGQLGDYSVGSAINSNGTDVTILNTTFSDNVGGDAPVFHRDDDDSAEFTITSALFRNNTNNFGGGGAINVTGSATISGGFFDNRAYRGGGAIHVNGSLDIDGASFVGNEVRSSGDGGAVYATIATINNASFVNNAAQGNGGAISVGTLTVDNSFFANNRASFGSGGAIHSHNASVDHTTILQSSATANGGAIATNDLTLHNSAIVYNRILPSNNRLFGGAVYATGTVEIANATVSGNRNEATSAPGGAVYLGSSATLKAINSTFADNVGINSTGSVRTQNTLAGGTIELVNTIVSNPTSDDPTVVNSACFNTTVTSLGHNIATDDTCNLTMGSDWPATDPLLEPLPGTISNNPSPVHALSDGSPALDGGDDAVCQAVPINALDQNGLTRIGQDGNGNSADGNPCDIGASERQD